MINKLLSCCHHSSPSFLQDTRGPTLKNESLRITRRAGVILSDFPKQSVLRSRLTLSVAVATLPPALTVTSGTQTLLDQSKVDDILLIVTYSIE
jgi:hypothetical protein